jgi:hypothetical protein
MQKLNELERMIKTLSHNFATVAERVGHQTGSERLGHSS